MFKNEISEQYGQQYFLEEENCSPPCRRTYKIQRESVKILFFIDFTMGRRPEHSEHPELTGRQVGDKCEIMRPEHSKHPELTRRQVGPSTQSIQSLLGDKWETSVKSCGQSGESTESIKSLLGDNWETNGTQV